MRKYRNDSLIYEHKSMNIEKKTNNLHNNASAGTVLQAIKRGKDGRPAVKLFVANRRRSFTSDDSRTGVQRMDNLSLIHISEPTRPY